MSQTREISRKNSGVIELLGHLYDDLGFSNILSGKAAKILKSLVLGRFIEPSSKHKASFILERRFGESISADAVYRMMDVLEKNLDKSREVIFNAARQANNGKIDLVLFDVTTLHFETVEQDELRDFGFSKNCKFNTTQVVLALATTQDGLPIGYRLFPGNTAEVSTLMECVTLWRQTLSINQIIVVGDRGMMSKDNVAKLEHANMQYIIAYPLRKASAGLKNEILSSVAYVPSAIQNELHWKKEIDIEPGKRLIVTYSQKRAIRDKKQREQLIERIQKKLGVQKQAKRLVSNQGYLKYTKIDNDFVAELNTAKIEEDELWDGMHGVLTNTTFSGIEAIERYRKLFIIEDAFRINKHNLKMRPIYHYTPRRIITHIEICFLTFALVRHAQERLKKSGLSISVEALRDELMSIESSILCDDVSGQLYRMPSYMTEQGRKIYTIFGREEDLEIRCVEAMAQN